MGSVWAEEKPKRPIVRWGHSAIYDPVNKEMIVFGGSGQEVLSDMWIFNIKKKKWEKIKVEETPSARRLQSAIYDSANKRMIIFGCRKKHSKEIQWFCEIRIFNIEKKTWEKK